MNSRQGTPPAVHIQNSGPEWWKEYFGGAWLEFSASTWPISKVEIEADRIWHALSLDSKSRVLDVPCGDGRFALALSRLGCHATGVDINSKALELALADGPEAREASFMSCDMRELPFEAAFEAAFCVWNSFGYFDDPGNARFLEGVSKSLVAGGRFLLDTHIVETLLPRLPFKSFSRVGSLLCLDERTWNPQSGCSEQTAVFIRGTQEEIQTSTIRIYTFRELMALLEDAGFHVLKVTDAHRSTGQGVSVTAQKR